MGTASFLSHERAQLQASLTFQQTIECDKQMFIRASNNLVEELQSELGSKDTPLDRELKIAHFPRIDAMPDTVLKTQDPPLIQFLDSLHDIFSTTAVMGVIEKGHSMEIVPRCF